MNLSSLITQLQALQARVGDLPVVIADDGGSSHLENMDSVSVELATPRVDLVDKGALAHNYFLTSSLATGGYGSRKAFTEPTQSRLERTPPQRVVVLGVGQ